MDTCAFTHEHPRTRRCSIHPRTLTTTLTNNTTNHCISVHIWISQSRKCLYLLSRISGCALLNLCWSTKEWVVAALGRRWTWRLWSATCRRASRRVPSPKTVGGQAAVFVNVLRQSRNDVTTRLPVLFHPRDNCSFLRRPSSFVLAIVLVLLFSFASGKTSPNAADGRRILFLLQRKFINSQRFFNFLRDVLGRFCSSYAILQRFFCLLFELDPPTDSTDIAPISVIQVVIPWQGDKQSPSKDTSTGNQHTSTLENQAQQKISQLHPRGHATDAKMPSAESRCFLEPVITHMYVLWTQTTMTA